MQRIKPALQTLQESPTASSIQPEEQEMQTVEAISSDVNPAFLFLELPDHRWQCPHWGFMLKGRIRVGYTDHEEVITAGDFYYLPAESVIFVEEETQVIEFGPQGNHRATLSIVNIS